MSRVFLTALSVNQLSTACSVITSYDTEAWRGVYDLATNKLLELADNQGNVCKQYPNIDGTYTCVDTFDWGNPALTNCTISSSTFNVTYGNTLIVDQVQVTNGSVFDITTVPFDSNVTNVIIDANSSITADGYVWFENVSFVRDFTVNVVSTDYIEFIHSTFERGSVVMGALEYASFFECNLFNAYITIAATDQYVDIQSSDIRNVTFSVPSANCLVSAYFCIFFDSSIVTTGSSQVDFTDCQIYDTGINLATNSEYLSITDVYMEDVTLQYKVGISAQLDISDSSINHATLDIKNITGNVTLDDIEVSNCTFTVSQTTGLTQVLNSSFRSGDCLIFDNAITTLTRVHTTALLYVQNSPLATLTDVEVYGAANLACTDTLTVRGTQILESFNLYTLEIFSVFAAAVSVTDCVFAGSTLIVTPGGTVSTTTVSGSGSLSVAGSTVSDTFIGLGRLNCGAFTISGVYLMAIGTTTPTANNTNTGKDYFNNNIV